MLVLSLVNTEGTNYLLLIHLLFKQFNHLKMKKLKIVACVPGTAAMDTKTPGRKFFKIMFSPQGEGTLNTAGERFRNVWEAYSNGTDLNIKADPLYNSIVNDVLGGQLPTNFNELAQALNNNSSTITTPAAFRAVVGQSVLGEITTHWVKPYDVEGSISVDKKRYQYTTLVFDGESEAQIFANQNHVIVSDPAEIEALKVDAQRTREINQAGKEARREERELAGTKAGALEDEASAAMGTGKRKN